ncbi:substrate-binding domain-containing protein [Halomonas sp. GD1P12]|uniref:substrate-binding domain-containing protein n=1 Tax=Halomonas sp. GD1P12 TaxID=2982691 RepID=UPI0021E4399B|nr:substrate-binding domain-containing protein [Halomonas sp. GD1P12]UYG00899.1 substrate-binding domain-containing protein [Halomonas sp. GD1P12]
MKKKRPTLQDIAERVGATKMTVSRCLRDPQTVSEGLRERIFSAAEQVGYIPNRAPELLSRAKSRSIGVLVPSLTNQVFADVILGIETHTEPAGFHLMLSHYGYSPALEERSLASLLSYNVDGVILSDHEHSPRSLRMLETAGIPIVEIMDTHRPPLHQAVGYDNVQAADDMVSAMIARGRRRIVYLAVRLDERTRQREQGYARAMARHGLEPVTLESAERSSYSVGASLMQTVLRDYPNADGLFCTNDDVAIGAYYECLRLGVRVPQTMALAGFHGHDVGQAMTPRLASVITPRRMIGEAAAKTLLERIDIDSNKNGSSDGNSDSDAHRVLDLGYRIELGETL